MLGRCRRWRGIIDRSILNSSILRSILRSINRSIIIPSTTLSIILTNTSLLARTIRVLRRRWARCRAMGITAGRDRAL